MFELREDYSKDIQERILEIEKEQIGIQVIKVKKWALPIRKYKFKLEVCKSKNLNIIEEFIIKLVLEDVGIDITRYEIEKILGLDRIFVNKYVSKLIEIGILEENQKYVLEVTTVGKKQFVQGKGLTRERTETIEAYLYPKTKQLYSKKQFSENPYEILESLSDNKEQECLNEVKIEEKFINEIVEIAKEDNYVLSKKDIQFVSRISAIDECEQVNLINFIEFWIYDIVEEKLYCRVWNEVLNRYSLELSEYIIKNKPIDKNDFNLSEYAYEIKQSKINRYENKFREEVRLHRENINQATSLKMVRGAEIKKEFDKCLKEVKNYLYIHSPWITAKVVDEEMISVFQKIVNRGGKIFISWGIARNIEQEDRRPSEELIEKLRNIKATNGISGVFVYWIGNHHNKEIIVDNKYHLAGSFNWLSYRGDYLPRGESVYITSDKNAIGEAKKYLEKQIFDKLINNVKEENYVRDINALINIVTKSDKVKEFLLNQIESLPKDRENFKKIYNIVLLLFKNKILEKEFYNGLIALIKNRCYLTEVYIMLDYLKKNNENNLYKEIMKEYKRIFVEANIINKDLKINNNLKKKNLANELNFKVEIMSLIK